MMLENDALIRLRPQPWETHVFDDALGQVHRRRDVPLKHIQIRPQIGLVERTPFCATAMR